MGNCGSKRLRRPVAILATVGLGSAACQGWFASKALQSAAAVRAEQQAGATVELIGSVSQQAPFLGGGAYELTDDSGTVWVVTAVELPAVGDRLRVRGTVDYRSVPVAGQEWGEAFVQETERGAVQP